jgi:hypothetical protein|tara:strand:+ start:886 stop:1167 length:282 start_codon:yes stop_codon:yes gene_type:complete
MSDIKLVKLKSGEELIGDVTVVGDTVSITSPCQLMPTQDGLGFAPWPSLSKHGPVSIAKDWVICITEPIDPAREGWSSKFGSGIVLPNMQLNG